MMPISNQQIFELLKEVKEQNNTIKSDVQSIKADLGEYKIRIQELENKVCELEGDNTNLRVKLRHFEEKEKKNQVIVFGLKEETEDLLEERVLDLFVNTLKLNIESQDLDNIYRIGTGSARPIIIRFVRYLNKLQILRNLSKLKNTGISIASDLTFEQQQDKKLLYKYYRIAKENGFSVKIIKNQLVVDENVFSIAELREVHPETFGEFFINKKQLFPSNSAPATPEVQSRSVLVDETVTPRANKNNEKLMGAEEKSKIRELKGKAVSTPGASRPTRQTSRIKSTSGSGKAKGGK